MNAVKLFAKCRIGINELANHCGDQSNRDALCGFVGSPAQIDFLVPQHAFVLFPTAYRSMLQHLVYFCAYESCYPVHTPVGPSLPLGKVLVSFIKDYDI